MGTQGTAVRVLVAALFAVLLASCESTDERRFRRAVELDRADRTSEAVEIWKKIVDNSTDDRMIAEASLRVAMACDLKLKKYPDAAKFYERVIISHPDHETQKRARLRLGDLYLNQLQDYPKAITVYSKLLPLVPKKEQPGLSLSLAKAYYYSGNYTQAEVELDLVLRDEKDPDRRFEAGLLLANILLASPNHRRAIVTLEGLLKSAPERAKRESIPLVLALAFEEEQNFPAAIAVLERYAKEDPREKLFLGKIRSLKERLQQQPGVGGLKK